MTPLDDLDDEPELGRGSMWLLRIGAVVFLAIIFWFLVHAIGG